MKKIKMPAMLLAAAALFLPLVPAAGDPVEAAEQRCFELRLDNPVDIATKDNRYLRDVEMLVGRFTFCSSGDLTNVHEYSISNSSHVADVQRPVFDPLSPTFGRWWNVGQPELPRRTGGARTFRLNQTMRVVHPSDGTRRHSNVEFAYVAYVKANPYGIRVDRPVSPYNVYASTVFELCVDLQRTTVLATDRSLNRAYVDGQTEVCKPVLDVRIFD